jgi:excisionase family DNA binding protein
MVVSVLTPEELEALLERAVQRALQASVGGESLTTTDAAQIAKRSTKTIRRWVTLGLLVATRRGRSFAIRRRDLDACLSGRSARRGVPAREILASLSK